MNDMLKACPIVVTNNTPEFFVTQAFFLIEKGNFKITKSLGKSQIRW
jgi:hypothetical protein